MEKYNAYALIVENKNVVCVYMINHSDTGEFLEQAFQVLALRIAAERIGVGEIISAPAAGWSAIIVIIVVTVAPMLKLLLMVFQ